MSRSDIPPQILRQLWDKSDDKRRVAAVEIQRIVTDLVRADDLPGIQKIISQFTEQHSTGINEQTKKGSLLALSAIAIAVSQKREIAEQVNIDIINPVLSSFEDRDSRIRFYAIESMYNIIKICRTQMLPYLPQLFTGLMKLANNYSTDVKKATAELDQLLKSVVVESELDTVLFNKEAFMESIYGFFRTINNENAQQTLISWIIALHSIPNFDMLVFLPNFIEGLFCMLADYVNQDVKEMAIHALKELLDELTDRVPGELKINISEIIKQLSMLCKNSDSYIRYTAIKWIYDLMCNAGKYLIDEFPQILSAILCCISDQEANIVEQADRANMNLIIYVEGLSSNADHQINYELIVKVLMDNLEHESLQNRQAVLKWLRILIEYNPNCLLTTLDSILEGTARRLTDVDDIMLTNSLELISSISKYEGYFDKIIIQIIKVLEEHPVILEQRGKLILKHICSQIGIEAVFRSISQYLTSGTLSPVFSRSLVKTMEILLLSDDAFEQVRNQLKFCLETKNHEVIQFYQILFKAWCCNPVSAIALAFMTMSYKLVYQVLGIVAVGYISKEILIDLSMLVQLLESPVFVHLRMQTLEYDQHPYLLRSLYAVLMILPQSKAFSILQMRLKNVKNLHRSLPTKEEEDALTKMELLDYQELVDCFQEVHSRNQRERK